MANHPPLTAECLRDRLAYDADTGIFTWRRRPHAQATAVNAGDVAGGPNGKGYINITVDGRTYRAHRLAWLYVHGEWPAQLIDHRDRDKANNRIANLRPATHAENSRNAVHRIGATGLRGVTRDKGKFMAQVVVNRRHVALCGFDTAEEAAAAYKALRRSAHGDFVPLAEA